MAGQPEGAPYLPSEIRVKKKPALKKSFHKAGYFWGGVGWPAKKKPWFQEPTTSIPNQ